ERGTGSGDPTPSGARAHLLIEDRRPMPPLLVAFLYLITHALHIDSAIPDIKTLYLQQHGVVNHTYTHD
ncbi:hypothetical protein Q7I36_21450, partial [Aeromonas veronii]|uniref:hypothetical protein n=1 Tax=Aeromonas veronii TaxID=654 RepID=UPI0030077D7C